MQYLFINMYIFIMIGKHMHLIYFPNNSSYDLGMMCIIVFAIYIYILYILFIQESNVHAAYPPFYTLYAYNFQHYLMFVYRSDQFNKRRISIVWQLQCYVSIIIIMIMVICMNNHSFVYIHIDYKLKMSILF